MTGVSGRGMSRIRHGLRAAACILAVASAACWTADNNGVTPPNGVIGITPGGSGGSTGGDVSGLYRLETLRDTAVPALIFYDSASSVDDTIFAVTYDSSSISLNTDTTAVEIDFLTIRDIRQSADSDVNRMESFGDTTFGTYNVSGANVTLSLTDTVGGAHTVITDYAFASNALTGLITYSLYNTAGQFVATDTSTAVYALIGPATNATSHALAPRSRAAGVPEALRPRPPAGARRITVGAMTPLGARTWRVPAPVVARFAAPTAHTRP
ncbi:MAG: hypothetical protein ACHQTF_08240 [Gemmatimonadales bacterium]